MIHGAEDLIVKEISADELKRWLPTLTSWLLPGAFYSVEHTWPQLYRSDGKGTFLAVMCGDRLVSHLALRSAKLQGERGVLQAGLIGSVATDPMFRGRHLATNLLRTSIEIARDWDLDTLVLWAERPELYAARGFVEIGAQWQAAVHRRGAVEGVRFATFADREGMHALHEKKPLRVLRDRHEMDLLLSIPGMWTTVLERQGQIVAYACCGKGADLQGWWHEVGGTDDDAAALVRGSLALLEQPIAMAMLPDYRRAMLDQLEVAAFDREQVAMAMALALTPAGEQRFFIDGLDSV